MGTAPKGEERGKGGRVTERRYSTWLMQMGSSECGAAARHGLPGTAGTALTQRARRAHGGAHGAAHVSHAGRRKHCAAREVKSDTMGGRHRQNTRAVHRA